ncbi:MAG TPA: TonB-dependent receptor [Deltaproteobacteria bacterium]|nr:TonB-dependent receptor [Deltaproteobacteria bacterium]HQB37885.1 TonB-dependent receptor [Deltaproteobacteria bacterium]
MHTANHAALSGSPANRLRRYLVLAVLTTLLCLADTALAQFLPGGSITADLTDLSVEQLLDIEVASVQSASRYEQKVTDAPALVNIVTRDEISKFGYRTLADALRSVPGMYVTNDRNYSYIGTHGFNRPGDYNTRILLMIDGHRINDNIYDQTFIGTDFPLDMDLVERIEIVHGPGSSLYGANAFFGVINVITRNGSDLEGAELSGATGSYNTYNGRISYGQELGDDLELIVSGSIMGSHGQDLYYKEYGGTAFNADRDGNYQFFSKIRYKHLTLSGNFSSREKRIPTAPWGTVFNTTRTRSTDERAYLDLKYERQFAGKMDVMARVFLDRYRYYGDYLFPGDTLNKDTSFGSWWGTEVQASRTFLDRLRLTGGVEYRNNFQIQQQNYDDGGISNLNDNRHSNIWALYLQGDLKISSTLTLNAGLRYDHYDTFGGSTNPRAGLIYRPFEKTTFKLLYGEAFRAPNAYELYYSDGSSQTGNPALQPEKIRTFRLIYEQQFNDNIKATLSGFYYRIDDLITQTDASGVIQFNNISKVDARGITAELEGKWAHGLQGRLSYTFQNAKDQSSGVILTNSPQHLAKAALNIPVFGEKLFTGIEEQFTGRRATTAGSHIAGFFTTNVSLFSRGLYPGLELSAAIYNLFDKTYGDPGSGSSTHIQDVIDQDGRAFRIKLTYRF